MNKILVTKTDIESIAKKLEQIHSTFSPHEHEVLLGTFGLAQKALADSKGSVDVVAPASTQGKPASLAAGFRGAFAAGVGGAGDADPGDTEIRIHLEVKGVVSN